MKLNVMMRALNPLYQVRQAAKAGSTSNQVRILMNALDENTRNINISSTANVEQAYDAETFPNKIANGQAQFYKKLLDII